MKSAEVEKTSALFTSGFRLAGIWIHVIISEKALQQIVDIGYTEALQQDGIHTILKYGIACYKKKCKVAMRVEKME